jgi:hypothetical protein
VVADELLVIAVHVLCLALHPVGEAFVELCALRLWNGLVGGVADDDMTETESGVVVRFGVVGLHQLLPRQRLEVADDGRPYLRGRELGDGVPREHAADDRRPLDDRLLLRLEPIESSGHKCLNRRRDRELRQLARDGPGSAFLSEHSVVDEHPEGLLDEERVALCDLRDPVPCLGCELRPGDEVPD